MSFVGALCAALWFNGVQLQFLAYSLMLIVVGLVVALWNSNYRLAVSTTPLNLALVAFASWLVLHLFGAQSLSMGIVNAWWLGSLALAYAMLVLSGAGNDSAWRTVLGGSIAVGTVLAGHALLQTAMSDTPGSSLFLNRNNLAAFLNLLVWPALLLAWQYWRAPGRDRTRAGVVALAAGLMVAATLSTGSRGAALAAIAGVVVGLGVLGPRAITRRGVTAIAVLCALALLVAWLIAPVDWAERVASLTDPGEAGATRFVIWRQAWLMLEDAPWHGLGVGAFALAWPAYRDPTDTSAGFYAHNDYLQLWIEAGWPGLLCLLLIIAAVFYQGIAAVRRRPVDSTLRVEVAALLAAFTTLVIHSLFTFNFYILPILLVGAALLARIQTLYRSCTETPVHVIEPARSLRPTVLRALLVGAAMLVVVQLGGFAASTHLQSAAKQAARDGNLLAALEQLRWSHQVAPMLDVPWYLHADLLRATLHAMPELIGTQRAELYAIAMDYLAHAEALNPLRAQVPATRASLCAENADLCGADWYERAAAQWRRALAMDPWLLRARVGLAEHLLGGSHVDEAKAVLSAGLHLRYRPSPHIGRMQALSQRLLIGPSN